MTKSNTPSAPGRRRTIFEGNNTAPAHEADDRGDAIVNARRDERHADATLARVLGDVAALDVELVLRGELVKRRFHALRASRLRMSTNSPPASGTRSGYVHGSRFASRIVVKPRATAKL